MQQAAKNACLDLMDNVHAYDGAGLSHSLSIAAIVQTLANWRYW